MTSAIMNLEKKICERCNNKYDLLSYIDHSCIADND